jgi:hypothetical protein
MRFDNYALEIPQGKELESGHVGLRHGQAYSLRMSNYADVRCDVEVKIDGTTVGLWRINARSII